MTALAIRTEQDLKTVLAKEYMKAIENFFGDPQLAREFLSNVVAATQRNPKLLECTPESLLNSFVMMASLKLMPSGVSGEAYVLPYKKGGVMEAQFQLGYQGLVTLFYRAGVEAILAEVIRANDVFLYENGKVTHQIDILKSSKQRGEIVGAYAIAMVNGYPMTKAMNIEDIMAYKKFSKSKDSDFSPWNRENDPESWMIKKTVLKQLAKLVPKNATLAKAIDADNKDSIVSDRKIADGSNFKLAPVEPDLTEYREALGAAKTIAELDRTWADIPGDAKAPLKAEMDAMRRIIESATSSDIV